MYLLAFDTAGPNCTVAVALSEAGEARILASAEERIGRGHAERLPVMVEETLAASGISHADLNRIAVTTGPGSFTGVRIGIAFARGLALALDIPAIGVGSLDALLYPLLTSREGEGTVAAILDARRGEVYATARDVASGARLIEAEALPVAELALRLCHARRPIGLTGSGAALVVAATGTSDTHIAGEADAPDIADVVTLALAAKESGPPVPLYARAPDAKPQRDKAVARP